LSLTYYPCDGLGKDSQSIVHWTAVKDEWSYLCILKRMNDHSKFGWWENKYKLEVLFHYFDLKADPKGKLTIIKISYGSNI
jgi:hypothetical protein